MDKNNVQTLIHLINSQSERTRKELMTEFSSIESRLTKKINQVEFKVDTLEQKLDDKFEDHRRKIVDEIQTFENHTVKENLTLSQEMTVNSARITRIEKSIFPS